MVTKVLVQDDGGNLGKDAFTIDLDAIKDGAPFMDSVNGAATPVTYTLDPEPYTVSETLGDLANFYAVSYSGDCVDQFDGTADGDLDCNENADCTVTNDDIAQQNQASIQFERLDFTVSDTDGNLLGDEIDGDFDISNQSEQPIDIVFSDFEVIVEVRENNKGKWTEVDATCTFDPDAPLVWMADLPDLLTVDFWCTAIDPEITPGSGVRVTGEAFIFGRDKPFVWRTSTVF
jgi:hypothetical protein